MCSGIRWIFPCVSAGICTAVGSYAYFSFWEGYIFSQVKKRAPGPDDPFPEKNPARDVMSEFANFLLIAANLSSGRSAINHCFRACDI